MLTSISLSKFQICVLLIIIRTSYALRGVRYNLIPLKGLFRKADVINTSVHAYYTSIVIGSFFGNVRIIGKV